MVGSGKQGFPKAMYETEAFRMTRFNALPPGASARVHERRGSEGMRRRLLDLGLTKGARVECLYASPWGDPTAYLVRGAVVALRGEEAGGVLLL